MYFSVKHQQVYYQEKIKHSQINVLVKEINKFKGLKDNINQKIYPINLRF